MENIKTKARNASTEWVELHEKIRSLENEIRVLKDKTAVLEKSEKKYRTIFETTGTATVVIEDDTTISMMNTEFERISGFSKKDVEGKWAWTDFVESPDRERMYEYHRKRRMAPDQAPRTYECKISNKWNEDIIAMMTVAIIPGTRQSVASVSNITERRRAEEALKFSEEKFSKAFRSSPQAMMISTLEGGLVVDVNDTFSDMTGYQKNEVLGLAASTFHLYGDGPENDELIRQISRSGRMKNREVTLKTSDGTVRYGNMSADIIDIWGVPCMLTSINDITEQRRLEAEILRISEAERRKIGYDLHDDLGQHLVGIEALSTLLKQKLNVEKHPEAPRASEIVSLIREAIEKTRNLAKGLCPVNMDEGGLVLSLTEFADHVEKLFGVRCIFNCLTSQKITNNAVATHLYHLVREAVNNALRHGKAQRVKISLLSLNDVVYLVVSDNGCGVKKSNQSQGLGLSIMEYRAKSIRASLTINSVKEKGTRIVCQINRKFLL